MNLMSLTWMLIYFKAAFNTAWSTHTCPLCVYRWVSWHRLQGSVTKEICKSALFSFFPSHYTAFYFSCPSHTIALKWNFVFRYKHTPCAPQLVWSMSWHQPVSPLSDTERQNHHGTSLKTLLRACRGRKERKKVAFHSQGTLNSQMHAPLEKPH